MGRSFPFSNFQPLSVLIRDRLGIRYATVEHAYQAAKTHNEWQRRAIANCHYPGQAKKMGRTIEMRPDWDGVKLSIMEALCRHKFTKCPEHRDALLRYDGEIIEDNYWHDNYWGVCSCSRCGGQGQNNLGKIIAKIRMELKQ